MGKSLGIIHFEDDTLMFTWYQNTADVMHDILRPTIENYRDIPYEESECTCGKDESVQMGTDYGGGYWWEGRACRHCLRVTKGHMPIEAVVEWDGYPEWWPEKYRW